MKRPEIMSSNEAATTALFAWLRGSILINCRDDLRLSLRLVCRLISS
jgi:hypothetical protein